MLLRMLNDPCQSETGRQMARANPQYRRCYARSQEAGAALARAVKSSTALAEIILFDSRATRGNVVGFQIFASKLAKGFAVPPQGFSS